MKNHTQTFAVKATLRNLHQTSSYAPHIGSSIVFHQLAPLPSWCANDFLFAGYALFLSKWVVTLRHCDRLGQNNLARQEPTPSDAQLPTAQSLRHFETIRFEYPKSSSTQLTSSQTALWTYVNGIT